MKISREIQDEVTLPTLMFTLLFSMLILSSCSETRTIIGERGPQGAPGDSCEIEALANGALITCGDNSVVVYNGTNGSNGNDGQDGEDLTPGQYSVAEVIDPCGKQGAFDEVLLKLANGQILAHYSDGGKQFLTLIGPGSYVTTDGTSCSFSISNNLTISW